MKDFVNDIMPYAETHYRVLRDRQHRAIAGLSMGGAHTLNIAIPHPTNSRTSEYSVPESSASFRSTVRFQRPLASPSWEQQHLAELDNAAGKKDWKLFWFSTGKDDFLLNTTKATVELFRSTATSRCFTKARALTPGPTGASI